MTLPGRKPRCLWLLPSLRLPTSTRPRQLLPPPRIWVHIDKAPDTAVLIHPSELLYGLVTTLLTVVSPPPLLPIIFRAFDDSIHRQGATAWDRFISSSLIFLARWLYAAPSAASSTSDKLSSALFAYPTHNTHRAQPHLPQGDILIHTGDLTHSGTDYELDDTLAWLNPHPHKPFIAGNHDVALDSPQTLARIPPSLTYPPSNSP